MPYNAAAGGFTPDVPMVQSGYGLKTPFGILLPPGGQVAAYVRSTGAQNGDDPAIASNLVATLSAGLLRVRAGLGDTVVVLPGHTESGVGTTMMANLVAGTRILGVGQGANMPVFRWTAATDNWALSIADVIISGLRLRLEGFNGVTEAITITGADNILTGCDIETASGASNVCTTAINISNLSAKRCQIVGNIFRGLTGSCTDGILVSAAVDQLRITDNEMVFGVAVSTTHANITLSGAATNMKILRNYISNNVASTCAIAVADVVSTGLIADNYLAVLTNGTASAIGIIFAGTTNTLLRCFQNFCSDEPGKSGLLSPPAAT